MDHYRKLNVYKIDCILSHRCHAKGATQSVELDIDANVILHHVHGISMTLEERINIGEVWI